MHDQNLAILKGLVCVAWADGRLSGEETEILRGLLDAFSATPTERRAIELFAKQSRTLAEVPLNDLSYDDRRVLLQHAVLVTFVDGEQHARERALIDELCEILRIPSLEAKGILAAAEERARGMMNVLRAV
jgi:tellurite resistance protein